MERMVNSSLVKQMHTVNPVFARHETFPPRFGWLKKGFEMVSENPEVFFEI